MKKLEGYTRFDVIKLMSKQSGGVGVELGVAAGGFSKKMVESGRFAHFFGIDVYGDNHDTDQYKEALLAVGLMAPYKILRMTFDEALELFDDECLDFIYIDGFAATGQEGGETIYKWSKKVRTGGVIAGDDYHDDWPLVQASVDRFAKDTGFELKLTTVVDSDSRYDVYPSWAVVKECAFEGSAPSELVAQGKAASLKLARKRATEQKYSRLIRRAIGEERFDRLRKWNRKRKTRR
jgi:Methyltransferase domain